MTVNDLDKLHRQTANLLFEINEQIDILEDKLFYDGQFYSGSINPEILFIGYNPGYPRYIWHMRPINNEIINKQFQLNDLKYIKEEEEEEKARLASQIHFMFEKTILFENPEKYLREKVAETNFIHFNTPDIKIYDKSIKSLDKNSKEKIENHFIDSFNELMTLINPKVLVIIGSSTFDQLNKKIKFDPIEILEKNSSNQRICARTRLNIPQEVKVIVTKHLSSPISDAHIGLIGSYIKDIIRP